jgi:hypothetical protein
MIFLTDDHRYVDAETGAEYPGVTSTIFRAGLMGFVPSDNWYLQRGTAVHEATELYDYGVLDESTVDLRIMPYLDAWKKYRADTGFAPDPNFIERIGVDEVLRYAGTLDRNGLDIKSGAPAPWHILQAAAYWHLDVANKAPWHAVYLHDDGTYKIKVYSPAELYAAFGVFCGALTVFNFKRENGIQ